MWLCMKWKVLWKLQSLIKYNKKMNMPIIYMIWITCEMFLNAKFVLKLIKLKILILITHN